MEAERRHINRSVHTFWDDLNLAQKFAVSELHRFGYDLLCVRHFTDGNLALLKSGSRLAAIDGEGLVNTEPNVKIRF